MRKESDTTKQDSRTWTSRYLRAALLVSLAMIVVPLALTPSAAAGVPGEEVAVQNPLGLSVFMIGLIGVVTVVVLYYVADIYFFDSGLGVLFVVIIVLCFVMPLILGAVVYALEPDEEEPPIVTPPTSIRWMITAGADLDVAPATYPAAPFTVTNTAVGGTTAAWVAGDNGNVAQANVGGTVTVSVHVDTDLNDNAALWMEPNSGFVEFDLIKLLDGPKSSAGQIEEQQYWGRIDSISGPVPTNNDNESMIYEWFYTDSVGRHHIGWQDENNNWLEGCSEYRGIQMPVSGVSCGPVPLGTDDTTGDTKGAIGAGGVRFFWVWTDRGPFSWHAQNGDTWTMTFSVGSETDWHTYTFIAHYTESATNNT